jgi:uncharacterized membrane protein
VGSKLGWLIAGRLVTALLLSVFGTIWTRAGEPQHTINKSLTLLTIVACLTIVYALSFASRKIFSCRRVSNSPSTRS